MALIQAYNPSSGATPGQEILSTTQEEIFTESFSAGQTFGLDITGSGVLEGTLIVNMMDKILMRGDEYDYSFDGLATITLNFDDDPTQYANGQIIFQISYAYNA